MEGDIGIRMAGKRHVMRYLDAAERDAVPGNELMDIIAVAGADIGDQGA